MISLRPARRGVDPIDLGPEQFGVWILVPFVRSSASAAAIAIFGRRPLCGMVERAHLQSRGA
jgi:hypothetical protein